MLHFRLELNDKCLICNCEHRIITQRAAHYNQIQCVKGTVSVMQKCHSLQKIPRLSWSGEQKIKITHSTFLQ